MVQGTFIIDMLATGAWIAQLTLVLLYHTSNLDTQTALMVLEALRLLRFLRVVRLMRNLLLGSVSVSITKDSSALKFLHNQHVL